ncbi:RNA polymerase sigma-70 factor [Nonlabens antarcticus]|uniref:RNA polymerase sigma-70 factor n=1 Tax=Nonlabens antarcticus TaxID=392714 RepID=UPI001890C630|nr:RNA polymerase sigma-70 factor [Nonlabens antarcticus]
MLTTISNEDLIERIAHDDRKAFQEIYERHAKRMLVYANSILSNTAATEDIVQNIFIGLWSKRTTIQIDNVSSYLFRAVKFQIFKYFRDQKFTTEDLTRLNILDISIDSFKKMEYDDLERSIHIYIEELPPRCNQIFKMSRFEYMSNKDIADQLGISIQAVKNQIGKALTHVKNHLKDDGLVYLFLFLFR